jgi:hypothetical protein
MEIIISKTADTPHRDQLPVAPVGGRRIGLGTQDLSGLLHRDILVPMDDLFYCVPINLGGFSIRKIRSWPVRGPRNPWRPEVYTESTECFPKGYSIAH